MSLTDAERAAWLEDRRHSIGASDAAALMGLSPWATPHSIWRSKVHGEEFEESEPMRLGRLFEEILAQLYAEVEREPVRMPEAALLRKPGCPWRHASLDRVRVRDGRPVELKLAATDEGWGEEGTDAVPAYYKTQALHQMDIAGRKECDFGVLIGGNRFRTYTVSFDEEAARLMEEAQRDFWFSFIEPPDGSGPTPPPLDYSHRADQAYLFQLQGFDERLAVQLDAAGDDLLQAYDEFRAEEATAKERKEAVKARLLALMGEAGLAYGSRGRYAKRSIVNRKGYPVAPTRFAKLDVRVRKEK